MVTFLEMLAKPVLAGPSAARGVTLERWHRPDVARYRRLFQDVGGDWLWFGRLAIDDAVLADRLNEPTRENYLPCQDGRPIGMLELDFADPESPELAYFGLVPSAQGSGCGRWLMGEALRIVWSRPDTWRLWVHTCTGDSPKALGFYRASGFVPYKRSIEVADDPRLAGLLPQDKAPHVPLLG